MANDKGKTYTIVLRITVRHWRRSFIQIGPISS